MAVGERIQDSKDKSITVTTKGFVTDDKSDNKITRLDEIVNDKTRQDETRQDKMEDRR